MSGYSLQRTIFWYGCNVVLRLLFQFGYHLLLSFREDEQSTKSEDNNINANNNNVKQDDIMASSAEDTEQPNNDEDIVSDEEFDQCNSLSMESQKCKMAELDDATRMLQAQFEVENRNAVERVEKVKEELNTSQQKETTITQECEEIKKRTHSLREDMKCLEKKAVEREKLESEERKKIAKEKRKIERKLKKIKAKKSAATETLRTSKDIEDEITEDVYLKEPLSSDQPLVHSNDNSTSIQLSFGGDGAASLKAEMSVENDASVADDDESSSCKDDISELCHKDMDAAEVEDDLQTEDNEIPKVQEENVESGWEESQVKKEVIDKDMKKTDDDSSIQDSTTVVFDVCFEDSSLSDQHISNIPNDALSVVRKEEEDDNPESWNALESLTLPCSRPEKYCFSMNGCLFTRQFDDRLLLQDGLKLKGSISAVVNISEQLLQKELWNIFKALSAVQNTRTFTVGYVKKPAAIEMKGDVSSEQEDHQDKEHCHMKEERSEIVNGAKALCRATKDLQVSLEDAVREEQDNVVSEIVEVTKKENEKLQNQIAALKEEAKTFEIEKQSLQTELEIVKLELIRLTFSELAAKKETASKMFIYSEEVRKEVYSKRKEKNKKRKNKITKLRKDKGDLEQELLSTKQRLSRKEHELEETKQTLPFLTKTAGALKQLFLEMDYLFENSSTLNSDLSSIPDDCSLNNCASLLDFCSVAEAGTREEENAGYQELSFDNELQAESKELITEEMKPASEELTSAIDEESTATLLTATAEEGSKAVEIQLVHLYEILKDSLQELQELKTALGQKQDSWKKKKCQRETDRAAAWLNNELCVRENQMEMMTDESAQLMEDLDATINRLEGELGDTQLRLKEKTEALENAEAMMQLQTSLFASREAKHEDIVKQLQEDLESTQTLLKEKKDVLEHTEAMLKLQTSLLASREAKHDDIVKQLQEDFESTQTLLKEKTDAFEHTEAKLQLQTSLLASAEAKHEEIVKQLEEDLENSYASLKEKKDALEQTEGNLQSQGSVFADTEEKYEEIIEQLHEELENLYLSLKERTQTLQETEARLQWLTSFFESTESKYEDIIKQLQGELESMHALAKERTTTLEQTQARLEMCLNNEKSQVVQKLKFGAVDLTQDEGELILAELACTKTEKTKLLREDSDVTARLELEKRKGKKDKDVLWKLFNAALKELEEKTKAIGELKMDPTESTIQALWLGSQKREMLEYDSNHKQSKKESKPMIGSIKQENYELNEENQRLNIELRQRIAEMTHDVEEDAPSRPFTVRGVFTHLS